MPHDAETMTFGRASSMRAASSSRREPAEHDGVNRAEARATRASHHRLRHARHVDDDAVALADAERRSAPGHARDLVAKLAVGEGPRSFSVTGLS